MAEQSAAARQLELVRTLESGNDVRQIVASSEGGRALRLLKKREDTKIAAEKEMQNIENETKKRKFSSIDQKFGSSHADHLEEEFKNSTVGLVSAAEFKARRQAIDDIIQSQQKTKQDGKRLRLQRKVNTSKMSFGDDVENDSDEDSGDGSDKEEEPAARKRGFGKNPTVNTSFLYDANREAELNDKRMAIIKEYREEQDQAKKEKLEVTYSYWDGSGHRRSTVIGKGFTIHEFLSKAKKELEKVDFPELRTIPADNLIYVKEDIILPHNITFYELIKEKARGKSGPLFHFDVHDDVRIASDIRIEKDESHAGKIVDRKWYERNKHIFPASRWEMYDKNRTFDTYTIHGDTSLGRTIGG